MSVEESRAGAPKGQKETNQGVKEALGRILEDGRGKSAGGFAKSHFSVLVSCRGRGQVSPDPIFAMFRARDKQNNGAFYHALLGGPPLGGDKEGVYYISKKQKHAEPREFWTAGLCGDL